MRPHPKYASSDPHRGAWATCDACGFIHNHPDLAWQRQWAGLQIINLRTLVCPRDLDVPNEAIRTIILPSDPDPVLDARPEQYGVDEGLYASFTASIAPGTDPRFPDVQAIMIVTNVGNGVVSTGGNLSGAGVAPGSIIGAQLSGPNPPGGRGNYGVTPVQTVASTAMTTIGNASSF
jgi:hypothetical protein